MKKGLVFGLYFILTVLFTMSISLAYLDPSSMTYIIQIVAGIFIALATVLGFYFKRMRRYFRHKREMKSQTAEAVNAPKPVAKDDEASQMLSQD